MPPTTPPKVVVPLSFTVNAYAVVGDSSVELNVTPTPVKIVVLAKMTGLAKLIAAAVLTVPPDKVIAAVPVVVRLVKTALLPIVLDNSIPPVLVVVNVSA